MAEGRGRVGCSDRRCLQQQPWSGRLGCLVRFEDGSVEEFGGHAPGTPTTAWNCRRRWKEQRLEQLPRHPDLTLRTDSKYLIDGLGSWIKGWKRKGWKTAAGKPVLNQDLWKALDAARLDDVPLRYVKGHSGDPDNERVDRIAVAFSHAAQPGLVLQQGASKRPSSEAVPEAAPKPLLQLLSRLEVADRLAQGGYSLSLTELAQLVEQPFKQLETKRESWIWRDWTVHPQENGRWTLQRREAGSGQS